MKKTLFVLIVVGLLSSVGFALRQLTAEDIKKTEKVDPEVATEYKRVRDLPDNIASLYGVKGVGVLVGHLTEDGKKLGFNRETIKTKVELKLRLAGIRVLTDNERYAMPISPYLYITINAKKSSTF